MGHTEGEIISFDIPAGTVSYEIKSLY
jgi:hypothetical protein